MTQPSALRNPQLDGSPFYWEAGSTGVLLCHGFTATTAEVRLLAQALLVKGYTVAGPLLPGHGTTPEDCNRYTWEDWYASLDQAYQQLTVKCKNVAIGGESTGALLALCLASQHPEAAAILCYAPSLRLKMGRGQFFLLSLLRHFITSIPKVPSTDDNPWQGYSVQPLKGAYQLIRLQREVQPRLPAIHQPIMIMQGRLDPTVHPAAPQAVFDRVSSPVKELHWLDNSTHCVILDKERELAAQLTIEFLHKVFN